jgi:hypothetical protein
MFPKRVPMERDSLSPEPMVYSFIYVHQSPQLRSHPTKVGKTYSHHPWSPAQTEVLHTLGAAWFPKGIIYDTAITVPVPCSCQHNTYHLGFSRPEPCCQHVS